MTDEKLQEDNKRMTLFIENLYDYANECSNLDNPEVQRDYLLKIKTFIKNFKEDNKWMIFKCVNYLEKMIF